jgi:diguanylate cyclase (GGDEF)-like protein
LPPRDIPKELVQISEICSTMAGHLPLSDILQILAQRLKSLVPFSSCAFFICGGNNEIKAIHVSGNFSEALQGRNIEIGKGISGWVAAHLRPILNTGPALDFVGLKGNFDSLSDALVVPITREDDCLGTVSLYAEKPVSYKEQDLKIMQTIANLIAPIFAEAIRNNLSDLEDIGDPITGLYRVSYLTAIGHQLVAAANESRSPISLIYIELRNLPQIVRNFGSNHANSLLKKIADAIKPELRQSDILVSYGTQGFVILLPGVNEEHAFRCVRRLKLQIKSDAISPGSGLFADCQMGTSFYPRNGSTILSLLQSAQENMRLGVLQKPNLETNVIDFYRA